MIVELSLVSSTKLLNLKAIAEQHLLPAFYF